MFLLVVAAFFGFLAFRGYPWLTLALAIPLVTLGGLLDTPPNIERLNIFASDVAKVMTKAVFVTVFGFAICKFSGQLFRRLSKPV